MTCTVYPGNLAVSLVTITGRSCWWNIITFGENGPTPLYIALGFSKALQISSIKDVDPTIADFNTLAK